jgi:hypothetical protein
LGLKEQRACERLRQRLPCASPHIRSLYYSSFSIILKEIK